MTTDRELVKNWEARAEFLSDLLLKERVEGLAELVEGLEGPRQVK